MKVIGKIYHGKYICEVNHIELEKFLNQYYNKLKKLDVGDEISLAKGYDFMNDTKSALSKTQKFLEANKEIIEAITSGVEVMGVK